MNTQISSSTLSIIKALGIILVVICHSATHTQLSIFAHLISIVIFFFVAGYLFNDDYLNKPLLFFKKKIVRYYIPWVVYGLVFVFLHNTFLDLGILAFDYNKNIAIKPYTIETVLHKSLEVLCFFKWKEPLLAPLWFLWGMFSGLCVFFCISWIAKKLGKNNAELVRAILVVMVTILGFLGHAYNFHIGIIYRPMVIAGLIYIGKLYSIYGAKIKLSLPYAMLCLLILLTATALKYKINIGGMQFGNPVLFLFISCIGNYMLLTFATYIDSQQTKLKQALNYIGKYTFSIMVLHYVTFKLVNLLQLWLCNYPFSYLAYYPVIPFNTHYWWVIYTLVGISIPLVFTNLVSYLTTKAKYLCGAA